MPFGPEHKSTFGESLDRMVSDADDEIALLREAASQLQEMCEREYEHQTQYSCTDRRNWGTEERCRYANKWAYETSLKLLDLAARKEDE